MGNVISKSAFIAAHRRKAVDDEAKAKVTLVQLPWEMQEGSELDRHQPVYAKRPDFSRDVRFQ